MKQKTLIILIAVLAFSLVCIGTFLAIELIDHPIRHWVDDLLYDNYNHYLPCGDLPSINDVNTTIQAYRFILDDIEQLGPGTVGWQVEEPCADKGDILFWYGSHDQRNQIEEMIGSEVDFFGIPIRMRNQ